MFRVGDDRSEDCSPIPSDLSFLLRSTSTSGSNNVNLDNDNESDQKAEAEELTIFGDFDTDDPDFAVSVSNHNSGLNLNELVFTSSSYQDRPSSPSRPRSRLGGLSRNGSNSSLRRTFSSNGIGRNAQNSKSSEKLLALRRERRRSSSSLSAMAMNANQANATNSIRPAAHEEHDNGLNFNCDTRIIPRGNFYLPRCPSAFEAAIKQFALCKPSMDTAECFTCGVSWAQEQFSFDCRECDGATMSRPCIQCKGSCGETWRRDIVASHKVRRAVWSGICTHLSDDDGDEEEDEQPGIVLAFSPGVDNVANQLSNL